MRWVMLTAGMGLALVMPSLIGCNSSFFRNSTRPPANPPPTTTKADPVSLVNYLNLNARKMQSIRAKVAIDAKQGRQPIGLDGMMACQKPRDFRMKLMVLGSPQADFGSNNDRFWYWIGKADPGRYFFCSYDNLASGKVRVPFPFQPDMVMAALNMAEYDPNGKFQLKEVGNKLELIQETTSPDGQAVKRTTVFNRYQAAPGQPQVLEHVLSDSKGKLICRAQVHKVTNATVDGNQSAVVPTSVTIEWPAQDMSMKLVLTNVEVNVLDATMAKRLFSDSDLGKFEGYDLARGLTTPAAGGGGIRRASATIGRPQTTR